MQDDSLKLLMKKWSGPLNLPNFTLIENKHFIPAIQKSKILENIQLSEISARKESPTFLNTIRPFLTSGQELKRVLSVLYTLLGTSSSSDLEGIYQTIAPDLSDHTLNIYHNKKLYNKIMEVWDSKDQLGLNHEERRTTEIILRNFKRAGATLSSGDKKNLKVMKSRLAVLGAKFAENLLNDEKSWFLRLRKNDLEKLPAYLVSACQLAAEGKGLSTPIITLSRSIIEPFLKNCKNRNLRKKVFQAWVNRGNLSKSTSNASIVEETITIRQKIAALFSKNTYSEYRLEIEMAKNTQNVENFLFAIWDYAKPLAERDQIDLQDLLLADGETDTLAAWDWRYYAEMKRKSEYETSDAEIKPYLQLYKVRHAAFFTAKCLFNLDFKKISYQFYNSDVEGFIVSRDGQKIGTFIFDYYARSGKRSGAWCSALQPQHKMDQDTLPIVINVCNFAKPAKNERALLSLEDAKTLFHEFGHALHQLLSNVTYDIISGTSVARDFVELPSQLLEHWLLAPEILGKFAIHVKTGEPLPKNIYNKIISSRNFDMAFSTIEFLASAIIDLRFHSVKMGDTFDAISEQQKILSEIGMINAIEPRHSILNFAHIFSGDGYASLYYSYIWAEVLDEDAFSAFEETGNLFNKEIAANLEDAILSKGGLEEPEKLYMAFRGRMPEMTALLKGRGFK